MTLFTPFLGHYNPIHHFCFCMFSSFHVQCPFASFLLDASEQSLKQASAKSTLPIGAPLHMTNRPSYDHSWPTMPCLWCWTNSRKQSFARITERKREALIKRQQQLSPQFSTQYEKEPVCIQRAAERGVKRR